MRGAAGVIRPPGLSSGYRRGLERRLRLGFKNLAVQSQPSRNGTVNSRQSAAESSRLRLGLNALAGLGRCPLLQPWRRVSADTCASASATAIVLAEDQDAEHDHDDGRQSQGQPEVTTLPGLSSGDGNGARHQRAKQLRTVAVGAILLRPGARLPARSLMHLRLPVGPRTYAWAGPDSMGVAHDSASRTFRGHGPSRLHPGRDPRRTGR
jgi:hypothetical protein